MKHGLGNDGYWVGAAIEVPSALTDRSKIKYTFGTIESATATTDYGTPDVINGKDYVVFYTNAGAATPSTFITIDWDGNGTAYASAKYRLDLTHVTWTTVSASVDESTFGANDNKFTVGLTNKTINITIDSALSYYNANDPQQGNGEWLGILIDTGITLTDVAYKTTGSSFITLSQADIDEAQSAGAGSATDTLVFWINAENGNGKTISLKQKDAPDKTAVTLTVNLPAAEFPVTGIIAAPLADQADPSRDVTPDDYAVIATKSSSESFTNIEITATDLEAHANGANPQVVGYWAGAAIEVPSALTDTSDIAYTFGTTESATAATAYGTPDVINGKDYAVFYTNAGAATPSTFITIDWDGDSNDYSPVKYQLDLSGINAQSLALRRRCDTGFRFDRRRYALL